MSNYIIKNISLVNDGKISQGDVLIKGQRIERVDPQIGVKGAVEEINGEGKTLFPGVIDEHVHFREPGLVRKGEIVTETRAAIAGGTTSFMEMPNTKPPVLTEALLNQKFERAAQTALANYSFYMGVSNDNEEEVLKINKRKKEVCGVKIFMGSSTGNLLVDNQQTLRRIFEESELLIATHCENEKIIRANYKKYVEKKGEKNLLPSDHPLIRNVEACYSSSKEAVALAKRYGARLHIVHVTTGKELGLFSADLPVEKKQITSEVCVHHLWFTADDYEKYGNKIKCNPAIKSVDNKEALWQGLLDGRLDCVATDNAPHREEEKAQPYYKAPAGLPLVQHGLLMMLEQAKRGRISLEKIVEKMCHNPAKVFKVNDRGFLREGYYADLVLLDLQKTTTVTKDNIYYKCGWSPFESHVFPAEIDRVFVNGFPVYHQGQFNEAQKGLPLYFDR